MNNKSDDRQSPTSEEMTYYGEGGRLDWIVQEYRKYRFEKIVRFFGQTILDVGGGTGFDALHLRDRFGRSVECVETRPVAAEQLREQGLICHGSLEEVAGTYDTVYLNHVIEHISPGEIFRFFSDLGELVKPGGTLVVISPVGRWFWDQPDHYRIYGRRAILTLFRQIGFEEEYSTCTGSQYFACNILRPFHRWIFSHRWALGCFYRVSHLSKRDLVMVGRKRTG